ncbi:MAG: carboxypeptidase regulatory-like domain-containing protein [Candidatus Marinimicrobia bacterium]|nr:carboxypeptidase regulatory-like domain-containing protein [Candidatus Neomarinimicrobiota bacterium]
MKTRILIITLLTLMASMSLGASLNGVVSDIDTGQPIEGATLNLFGSDPGGQDSSSFVWLEVISDETGYYSFSTENDGSFGLTVYATGFQFYTNPAIYISGDMNLDISLQGDGVPPEGEYTLSGTVGDSDSGEPIEGAFISLISENDSSGVFWMATITNEQGNYQFESLAGGNYAIMATAQGYQESYESISLVEGQNLTIDFSLTAFSYDGELYGTLTNGETSEPIVDASIMVMGMGAADTSGPGGDFWDTFSDEDGNYSLTNLVSGDAIIWIQLPGFEDFFETVTIEGVTQFNIALTPLPGLGGEGTLTGTVGDSNSGQPIEYAWITLIGESDSSGFYWLTTSTSEEGTYLFENLADGNYTLTASAQGYVESDESISLVDGQSLTLDFSLTAISYDGELYGTITNSETDEPIANANIVVLGIGADPSGAGFWETFSDEEGNFSLTNLVLGNVAIWIQVSGFEYYFETVTIEGVTQFNIALTPLPGCGTISGDISYDEVGGPASAWIWLVEVGGSSYQMGWAMTDDAGHYELLVPAGDYYAVCMANNWDGNPGSDSCFYYFEYYDDAAFIEDAIIVTVGEGAETQNINFGIPAGGDAVLTAMVSGVISNNTDQTLANVEIALHDQDGNLVGSAITNSDGAYSIDNLEVGSVYNLTAASDGYSETSQVFEQKGMISVVSLQVSATLAIDDLQSPSTLSLDRNYPNPFNPSTTIAFTIPESQNVRVVVHDIQGNQIAELTNNHYSAGHHTVSWDGFYTNGSQASSGVYFYSLISESGTMTQRMLLTK